MKKLINIIILLMGCTWLAAQTPSVETILKNIDKNMMTSTAKSVTRMVVHGKRSSRTLTSINYSAGADRFYTEYTDPPREKGTKMLKSGSNLWIYDPNTDRTVQISGNMLKQSVMGSDLSYEDFMEETSLQDAYTAVLEGQSTYDKREVWVLLLTARKKDMAYQTRRLYVDKERFVVLYELLYAKSGKLLKTVRSGNVTQIEGRWYPRYIHFKDELKDGKGTEYFIDSITFNIKIPDSTFSKAMLKK